MLLAAPVAAMGAPAPVEASLTVNPHHGRPTAPLTATYRLSVPGPKCPSRANFFWDNRSVGEAKFGDACIATLPFTPPAADRAPGAHQVSATADGGHRRSTTYVVDPASPHPTSPGVSPTQSPPTIPPTTGAPTPDRSWLTPTLGASTLELLPVPAGPEESTPAAIAARPASERPAVRSAQGRKLFSAGTLVAGGGLVLLGVIAMGLLFIRSRREPDDAADTATVLLPRISDQ
jgi:hypothetical protein